MSNQNKNIWNEEGELVPLIPAPVVKHQADIAAIVVSRNRPDLVGNIVDQLKKMGKQLRMDIYVIEMGTDEEKRSPHCSFYYKDEDFLGKCYGHNVGLRFVRSKGKYKYYWILMNDLVFKEGEDTIQKLVDIMETNHKLAILSPTELDSGYPGSKPKDGRDFHLVSTCDYLALLIRAQIVDEVGFLNPVFKYSWGAIHELAYKLYSKGWHVAYCDKVTMKHLGGTTYGKVKGMISREEYQRNAKEFCAHYFREYYGNNWDEEFTKTLPPEIEFNTFKLHRRYWESVV